ncbi:MAG: hypothetical protein R3D46_04850 [Defluviimonas denitrificans]
MAGVDRWALAVLAVALWTFRVSLKRGAAAFGLAFVFVIGGAAQLYLTEASGSRRCTCARRDRGSGWRRG